MKACENCGKEFRHTPSTNPRFCCFACYRQAIAKRDGETSIEKKVRLFLQTLNIPFEQEYKMARYSLDFFIPLLNLVIECDGTYWHRDAKRDRAKNQYLKRHGFKVLRLSEDDINSGKSNNQIELHILNKKLKLI
jgi:very-short-patch-repair endonuclease